MQIDKNHIRIITTYGSFGFSFKYELNSFMTVGRTNLNNFMCRRDIETYFYMGWLETASNSTDFDNIYFPSDKL